MSFLTEKKNKKKKQGFNKGKLYEERIANVILFTAPLVMALAYSITLAMEKMLLLHVCLLEAAIMKAIC